MTDAERALLTRAKARMNMADAFDVECIIAERDALKAALAVATQRELAERRICGRVAQELEVRTGTRVMVWTVEGE